MNEVSPAEGSAPAPHSASSASRPVVWCVSCRYDIADQPIGGVCPECGEPVLQAAAVRKHHGKAKAALVLGMISMVTWWAYLLPPALLAFIAILLARRARREIGAGHGAVTSIGLAQAAEACAWTGLALSILYGAFVTYMLFTLL